MPSAQPTKQAKPPSLEQQLDRAVCGLDKLIGEVRGGIRNQVHFNTLEGDAQQIAAKIVSAFRGAR